MLSALLLFAIGPIFAADEVHWHQIWLNGERVGSLKTERSVKDGRVTHVETFSVTLARADTDVAP